MVGHKVEDSKQIGITCQLCTGLVKQCRSEFMWRWSKHRDHRIGESVVQCRKSFWSYARGKPPLKTGDMVLFEIDYDVDVVVVNIGNDCTSDAKVTNVGSKFIQLDYYLNKLLYVLNIVLIALRNWLVFDSIGHNLVRIWKICYEEGVMNYKMIGSAKDLKSPFKFMHPTQEVRISNLPSNLCTQHKKQG